MNKSSSTGKVVSYLIGYFMAALALFPLVWIVISGFKSKTEVLATPFHFLPKKWLLHNYTSILQDPTFLRTAGITFAGALVFAFGGLIINSMAAYTFARLEFRFKKILWVYVMITMFTPQMAILITSFIVVTKLHMLNTMYVLIIPGIAQAYGIFFIRQFYLNVPLAVEEAALIDGANRFKIYYHIFLPMSYPPFVIIGIGMFLGFWNSYIWPVMTITDPKLYQIMQYLANFRSARSTEMGLLMAGSALAAVPTIALFLVFQKYIMQGIKISGLK